MQINKYTAVRHALKADAHDKIGQCLARLDAA